MHCASAGKYYKSISAVDVLRSFVSATVLLATLAFTGSSLADGVPSTPDIRRFAEDVAIGQKPGAHLVKWTYAPKIRLETLVPGPRDADTGRAAPITGTTKISHYAALGRHVAALSEMTGMHLRLMPRDIGTGGDIVISIVPRMIMSQLPFPGVPAKTLGQLMGPSRCFFVIWPNPDWSVKSAKIVINSLLEDSHITHCLLEELTQSLGLPNDSERLRPSVFNETSMLTELSPIDRILIRTVYDPRIKTGISLGAFRENVEPVIETYRQTE